MDDFDYSDCVECDTCTKSCYYKTEEFYLENKDTDEYALSDNSNED
jgi:ferredoxin